MQLAILGKADSVCLFGVLVCCGCFQGGPVPLCLMSHACTLVADGTTLLGMLMLCAWGVPGCIQAEHCSAHIQLSCCFAVEVVASFSRWSLQLVQLLCCYRVPPMLVALPQAHIAFAA